MPDTLTIEDLLELCAVLKVLADCAELKSNHADEIALKILPNGKVIPVYSTTAPVVAPVPTMIPGDCPPPPAPCVHIENGVAVWEPWL